MAHHLEGRVDLTSAMERSRLLSSLTAAGSVGPLASAAFTGAETPLSHLAGTESDVARPTSPTSTLQQYGRFIPATALHSSGGSYAMMASYLSNGGRLPETLKHMFPDVQQYWSAAAHSEGYARYVLGNMYYPYLPYLPATESLALFAQNSAGVSQMEAVLQAQAVQHRIYDLQKEALFGQHAYTSNLYPHTHLFSPTAQIEATNLSVSNAARERHIDKSKEIESGKSETKRDTEKSCDRNESAQRHNSGDTCSDRPNKLSEGSERTRGRISKTDDKDKIKSSSKALKSPSREVEGKKCATEGCVPENLSKNKIVERKNTVKSPEIIVLDSPNSIKTQSRENVSISNKTRPNIAGHSPPLRLKRSTNGEQGNAPTILHSPGRRSRAVSPKDRKQEKAVDIQEVPENLCIKDKCKDSDKGSKYVSDRKTLSIVATSTITVTSSLSTNSSYSPASKDSKDLGDQKSQLSPSSSGTVTTYSLPYYHNLFARNQPQDGRRVHATTYVPEIGTISSPVAGAPSVIDVVDAKHRLREKLKSADGEDMSLNYRDSTALTSKDDVDDNNDGTVLKCNNHVCVHTDAKSVDKDMSKPSDFNGGYDTNDTIDLSVKKTKVKSDCIKEREKSVISKREELHSPKSTDDHKNDVQDLRKCHSKVNETGCDSVKRILEKRKACDLNHNSKENNEVSKKCKRSVPSSVSDSKFPIAVDNQHERTDSDNGIDEEDLAKDSDRKRSVQECPGKCEIKPLGGTNEKSDRDKTNGKSITFTSVKSEVASADTGKIKSVGMKLSEGSNQSNGIPVGIAVARQRNIAPKLLSESESKKTSEDNKKHNPVADVKPIRPLKVIRPSTKGCGSSSSENRNELPANLIVTGGATNPGVFWADDPASRQIAAQYLQAGHPLTPTSWYGSGSFTLPQSVTTSSTSGQTGGQVPLTVPAGYKLAQDSMTGQILLLPTGSEMYDSTRLFPGLPVGSHLASGSTFGSTVLPGPHIPVSNPSTQSLFTGSHGASDKPTSLDLTVPAYGHMYNTNGMQGSDVPGKDDKVVPTVMTNPANIIPSPMVLTGGPDSTPHAIAQDNEKPKLLNLTLVPEQQFAFQSPSVPILFNSSLLASQQSGLDMSVDVNQTKTDHTSVQSRGTSPMLPASDSCAEDTEENKSDDNTDDFVNVCDTEDKTEDIDVDKETTHGTKKNKPLEVFENEDNEIVVDKLDIDKVDTERDSNENTLNRASELDSSSSTESEVKKEIPLVERDTMKTNSDKGCSETKKLPVSSRNIFTDLTEYNPFMDPQVLQAADGLELLSALAEKSAVRLEQSSTSTVSTENKSDIPKFVEQLKCAESEPLNSLVKPEQSNVALTDSDKEITSKDKVTKSSSDENKQKQKSRVKCGFAFKPKKEHKSKKIELTKRMTSFCGITLPEDLDSFLQIDDEMIDNIEAEMKMRLAELQKRYKEKQRQLAKLTPKKFKDTEKSTKEEGKDKTSQDISRGPGRPKKKIKDAGLGENGEKKPKLNDNSSKSSSPTSSSCGSSGGQHGPAKKKKLAEMLVDRVFRKTASSFKIPLSKKINLIAPARIEFPAGSSSTERNEHARHNKSLDLGKLIKRSRLSQINGKESNFVGGLWHRKYGSDKKHSAKSDIKLKKLKGEHGKDYSSKSGLNLLAEYATKTCPDNQKRKRKSEEDNVTNNLSPDSPNKKRKPGRPKKCDNILPGVTETIVAKQSKHMDFFRWQTDEPKQERTISLEGKAPLKPIYLDEWNVRRSERIFLSDPSPQTSPNAISPGTKAKQEPAKSEKSKKPKQEKLKKSQSLNISQKVKKKYSTGFSQFKAREKTTELLKATRDRLTKKRQERKSLLKTSNTEPNDDSDSDDLPLSLFRPKLQRQGKAQHSNDSFIRCLY